MPRSSGSPRDGGSSAGLDVRLRGLLAALVRQFVECGEPVSSLWLSTHAGLSVSSATIRNMLSRLEELGYVHQPHTSAGRVPTDLGYRCYVDMLLGSRRRIRLPADVEERLRDAGTVDEILASVSHELSRVSNHVGFAVAPANEASTLEHIEFVVLEGQRVLVVVISTGGQIAHKVVELDEPMSAAELAEAANVLNVEYRGWPIAGIRAAVLQRLVEERTLYDAVLARTLRLASSGLNELAPHNPIFVHGASSLLTEETAPDYQIPLETLGTLLAMIEEKDRLIRLLTGYIEGPGVAVVIGHEHVNPHLQHFSVVVSSFSDGANHGTIGVIGPTRMRYSRTIAAVDGVSQAISRVLGRDA